MHLICTVITPSSVNNLQKNQPVYYRYLYILFIYTVPSIIPDRTMSSHWAGHEEEEGEDEDDLEYKSFDDHIIFLIDSRKEMLRQNSRGEVILVNVLKLLLCVLKSKIVESDKSCVGAVCFGTVSHTPVDVLHPPAVRFTLSIPM